MDQFIWLGDGRGDACYVVGGYQSRNCCCHFYCSECEWGHHNWQCIMAFNPFVHGLEVEKDSRFPLCWILGLSATFDQKNSLMFKCMLEFHGLSKVKGIIQKVGEHGYLWQQCVLR